MTHAQAGRWLAIAASVVIAVAVSAAIVQYPPSMQRLRKLDERRAQDLNQIENAINAYWHHHKALPASLDGLSDVRRVDATDPETKEPYLYEKTGDSTYRLCAVFALDNSGENERAVYHFIHQWRHGAGKHCFDRSAPKTP